jgi:hypothetical protein
MGESDTERFLRLLNEQNERIAAYEEANQPKLVGEDPIRLQREKERRDKWETLRARSHASKHPQRVRRVFPFVDPS